MRKRIVQYLFRLEFFLASLLVMVLVQVMILISASLPEADETSFLNPVLDRIDFLNIADVSLDAIFAVRDMEFLDPHVVVVNIGEVAPAPDGKIAAALYRLHALGARVIGIDVILDELHLERFPAERIQEVEDLRLAIRDVPNVVVASGFDPQTRRPTFEILPPIRAVARHYGFVNLVPDPDGVVRRFLPHAEVEGERWLGFPVKILHLYDSTTVRGILRQPSEEQIIYYTSTYEQIQSVPLDDVLFNPLYEDSFRDKIVLMGFVREGGLVYLGDMHKTPIGRKVGIEGVDMPGVFIHANVINMLLQDRFIEPIPLWGDWLLVFLLAYISIALYRVLRTKPPGRFHVAILITLMLFTEAVIVFFLPLIAFFYFDLKISYNLMATAVLLFIPANALTTWLRFQLRQRRVRRGFPDSRNPLPDVLRRAFLDNEPFLAHTRLLHAALVLPQFACCCRTMQGTDTEPLSASVLQGALEDWAGQIPEIAAIMLREDAAGREFRYFLRFLAGRKDEMLRESLVKEQYLSTELQSFNEFVYFEEWELLLPRVMTLWQETLRDYLCIPLLSVGEDREPQLLSPSGKSRQPQLLTPSGKAHERQRPDSADRAVPDAVTMRELPPGLYRTSPQNPDTWSRISPLCEWAECKLHRQKELFVFNGFMFKQRGISPVPSYLGLAPNCEPVLPERATDELYASATFEYPERRPR